MSIAEIAEVLDETEERIQEIASAGPGEQAENRGLANFASPYPFGTICIFRSVFPLTPGTCPLFVYCQNWK